MKRQQQAGNKASKQAGNSKSRKAAWKTVARPLNPAISDDLDAQRSSKPGPRMPPDERDLLLKLLVAGFREGAINSVFRSLGYAPPASSALAYYRERWRDLIDEARARRTETALTEGLALRAERVAKLKEHAAILEEMRFTPDKNGRLWNERAWRQTLDDIAAKMGERRPKESEQSGEVVKVVIGVDPDRV
jgi:hypothetical protein